MYELGKVGQLAKRRTAPRAECMRELFGHPLSQAALWFAVIFALLALAVLLMRKWRGDAAQDRLDAHELLIKFREMHLRGGLSDDEYRTIKTKLATQIDAELNSTDESS